MFDFSGKTILVTGGASGIGRALTLALARRGASVAAADVNMQGLQETLQAANALVRTGAQVRGYELDVTEWENWQRYRQSVLSELGAVDGIINNAGIALDVSARYMTHQELDKVMGINFNGMVYGCKTFMEDLLQRDEAFIANVSSIFGLVGVKHQAAYCSSKFAIRGYTEALMEDLYDTNVHVASIHPGHIGTDIAANALIGEQNDSFADLSYSRQEYGQKFAQTGLAPDAAAEIILKGLARRQHWITVGQDAWGIRHFLGWAPNLMPRLVNRFLARKQEKIVAQRWSTATELIPAL